MKYRIEVRLYVPADSCLLVNYSLSNSLNRRIGSSALKVTASENQLSIQQSRAAFARNQLSRYSQKLSASSAPSSFDMRRAARSTSSIS